ncbi:MAG TPA: PAS domain-containing protein, partial [Vicinamibacterales bacterium]|nr:PAS domain-containing protein [Vicinamibacterales bacterium]
MPFSLSTERPPAGDVILIVDAHGRVAYCTGNVEATFGRKRSETAGAPVAMLIDGLPPDERTADVHLLHASGSVARANVRVEPWHAPNGQLFTTVIIAGRAEEHYRELAAMFEAAQRVAHVGSFSIDVTTGAMRWSDEMYRIHGLAP